MTRELAQEVVDAVRKVCNQYNVVLTGICLSENTLGEIEIEDDTAQAHPHHITNKVDKLYKGDEYYIVEGIGDLK
jgi:hypothetical protein